MGSSYFPSVFGSNFVKSATTASFFDFLQFFSSSCALSSFSARFNAPWQKLKQKFEVPS